MKKAPKLSAKRSRANNAKNMRAMLAAEKTASRGSSSEEATAKKSRRSDRAEDDIDGIVDRLQEDMANAMVTLTQNATEDRNELEQKLDMTEFKLDKAQEKINELRRKYEAAIKREKRRFNGSNSASTDTPTSYIECNPRERKKRVAKCLLTLKEMIGVDSESETYSNNRDRLLIDIATELNAKTKMTLEEDIRFTILYSLPDHYRECIKQYFRNYILFDPFASTSAVRNGRRALCSTESWKYVEFDGQKGCADGRKGRQIAYSYYDTSIDTTALVKANKLNLDSPYHDIVVLVIQIDKGGSITKMGFSISNLIKDVGSPSNFSLIGLTSLSEDHANMRLAFGDVFKALDKLNGTSIPINVSGNERVVTIRLKLGGDLKSIAMIKGHGGASSKYYCPRCEAVKCTMGSWDPKTVLKSRTSYVLGEYNVSKEPLLETIEANDVIFPVNHTLTGVTKKALVMLSKLLGNEALEWTEDDEERVLELTKSMTIASSGLEQLRKEKTHILAVKEATNNLGRNDHGQSKNLCSPLCIFNLLETDKTWDMKPCSECDQSNHTLCARFMNGEIQKTDSSGQFQCIVCRGETKDSLIASDMEIIISFEEEESELMEEMRVLEGELDDLLRQKSRTNEKLLEALEKMKLSCGVYQRHYYADLIGCDARRLTEPGNALSLWSLIDDLEVRQHGLHLFNSIYEVFNLLSTNYQSPAEIAQFDHLVEQIGIFWSHLNPNESVTLKIHGFIHMSEDMRREGHCGREIELIENTHHVINSLLPRYQSITPLSKRLEIIVNRYNSKRFLLL